MNLRLTIFPIFFRRFPRLGEARVAGPRLTAPRPTLAGGQDLVNPGRLMRYAIGTTARPQLGGVSTRPTLGRAPEQRPPLLDPPGAATLPGERA